MKTITMREFEQLAKQFIEKSSGRHGMEDQESPSYTLKKFKFFAFKEEAEKARQEEEFRELEEKYIKAKAALNR